MGEHFFFYILAVVVTSFVTARCFPSAISVIFSWRPFTVVLNRSKKKIIN